jgi:maleate cis-trans isomerase
VDALHALGARKIGMITPYLKELTQLVAEYIEDAGIEVGDAISLEVSDNRAVGALDPEALKTHWKSLDLRDCDAGALRVCSDAFALGDRRGRARERLPDAIRRYGYDVGDPARA